MTTYEGVISTGSYRLIDGAQLRTPGSGLWNVKGTDLENYGVPPDVYVDNTPEDFLNRPRRADRKGGGGAEGGDWEALSRG